MGMDRGLRQNVLHNASCEETAPLVLLLYNLHFCTRAYLISSNSTHLVPSLTAIVICLCNASNFDSYTRGSWTLIRYTERILLFALPRSVIPKRASPTAIEMSTYRIV